MAATKKNLIGTQLPGLLFVLKNKLIDFVCKNWLQKQTELNHLKNFFHLLYFYSQLDFNHIISLLTID